MSIVAMSYGPLVFSRRSCNFARIQYCDTHYKSAIRSVDQEECIYPTDQVGVFIVSKRPAVAASEESKIPMSTQPAAVEEPLADADDLLKCFSPLLRSMRVFGLYFKRASRRISDETGTTDSKIYSKWNGGRIYAIFSLTIVWLNTVRMLSVFEKTDKFGFALLLKLSAVSATLLSSLQQTACFVACQTGNLDQVFCEARLSKSYIVRYRRLAVIHTFLCWFLLVLDVLVFLLPEFMMENLMDAFTTPFGVHIIPSGEVLLLTKILMSLTFVLSDFTWFSAHSVNYMVTSVLYDQFHALNQDFRHAVGRNGELNGNIREFRRRHQKITRLVQNADQFVMISNVAGFCCQIFNVILILYCTIFFRNETVGNNAISAVMYVYWLASTLFGLTLTACLGVVINHEVIACSLHLVTLSNKTFH